MDQLLLESMLHDLERELEREKKFSPSSSFKSPEYKTLGLQVKKEIIGKFKAVSHRLKKPMYIILEEALIEKFNDVQRSLGEHIPPLPHNFKVPMYYPGGPKRGHKRGRISDIKCMITKIKNLLERPDN